MPLTSSEHLVPVGSIRAISIEGDSIIINISYGNPSAIDQYKQQRRAAEGKSGAISQIVECRLCDDGNPSVFVQKTLEVAPATTSTTTNDTTRERSKSKSVVDLFISSNECDELTDDVTRLASLSRRSSYQLVFGVEEEPVEDLARMRSLSEQNVWRFDDPEFFLDGAQLVDDEASALRKFHKLSRYSITTIKRALYRKTENVVDAEQASSDDSGVGLLNEKSRSHSVGSLSPRYKTFDKRANRGKFKNNCLHPKSSLRNQQNFTPYNDSSHHKEDTIPHVTQTLSSLNNEDTFPIALTGEAHFLINSTSQMTDKTPEDIPQLSGEFMGKNRKYDDNHCSSTVSNPIGQLPSTSTNSKQPPNKMVSKAFCEIKGVGKNNNHPKSTTNSKPTDGMLQCYSIAASGIDSSAGTSEQSLQTLFHRVIITNEDELIHEGRQTCSSKANVHCLRNLSNMSSGMTSNSGNGTEQTFINNAIDPVKIDLEGAPIDCHKNITLQSNPNQSCQTVMVTDSVIHSTNSALAAHSNKAATKKSMERSPTRPLKSLIPVPNIEPSKKGYPNILRRWPSKKQFENESREEHSSKLDKCLLKMPTALSRTHSVEGLSPNGVHTDAMDSYSLSAQNTPRDTNNTLSSCSNMTSTETLNTKKTATLKTPQHHKSFKESKLGRLFSKKRNNKKEN